MIAFSLGLLLLLLALSVPVAAALGMVGLVSALAFSDLPLWRALGEVAWKANTEYVLFAIPLFVMLGEILLRSGIAERMYAAMALWLSWLPGGLMHSNIAACTLFASTSGSSFATAATVGTVAMSQVRKYEYNEPLFCGSLASGGTLGILIPPSVNMIVYGVLTGTSIPRLYLAGFLPGILLAFLFMATIAILCLIRPEWSGRPVETSWPARLRSLPDLLPPLLIFAVAVGSIYAGIATPTEAAALAVLFALLLVGLRGRLSLAMMREVVESTIRITAMALAIIMAAFYLNFVLSLIGLTAQLNTAVAQLGLPPLSMLLAVILFYLVLGMFMETLSMMIATVPFIAPIIIAAGYDAVWFGVLIMLLIETAMITPPVGTNLFIIQAVRGRGQVHDVMLGALPFVLALLVMILLLVAFPDIALLVPDVVLGRR